MLVKIFLILLLIPSLSFAANYYVDPTYDGLKGSPNGTFTRPWTNMAGQVRAHSFSPGDRLYFKSGTVTSMDTHLVVNWHGTEKNRVIIGTYFGENDFGNGNVLPSERAVLDGQNFLVPRADWVYMIEAQNHQGYVTIQDLEIKDSGWGSVVVGNTHVSSRVEDYAHIDQYFIVRNVYSNRPWGNGITFQRTSHGQALNNAAYRTSHGHWRTHPHRGTHRRVSGGGIEMTGIHVYGATQHAIVSGNTVWLSSYEGIGVYMRASDVTVTNNIVYDCSVNIYVDGSSNVDIYNNLVYATPEARRGQTADGFHNVRNIQIQHEYMDQGHFPIQAITENVRIFNNYVAGGHLGIGVEVQAGSEHGWRNVEIFNNRIVNNRNNLGFVNMHVGDWQNNYIYGNYSFLYETEDGQHTRINSPHSFKWNRDTKNTSVLNHFTGNKIPTGNAGQDASINNAHLAKKTGWRNLSPGEVTIKYFSLLEEDKQILEPKAVKGFSIIEGGVNN